MPDCDQFARFQNARVLRAMRSALEAAENGLPLSEADIRGGINHVLATAGGIPTLPRILALFGEQVPLFADPLMQFEAIEQASRHVRASVLDQLLERAAKRAVVVDEHDPTILVSGFLADAVDYFVVDSKGGLTDHIGTALAPDSVSRSQLRPLLDQFAADLVRRPAARRLTAAGEEDSIGVDDDLIGGAP